MPKNRVGLFFMATCVVAALGVAVAGPDIAVAKPQKQEAPAAQIQLLKKKVIKSRGAVRFWENPSRGRWMLHLRHKKCWEVQGHQRRKVCRLARQMYRFHKERLSKLEKDLYWLSLDVGNVEDWLCIHSGMKNGRRVGTGEGSWTAIGYVNGRATYYGGLQMDLAFQRAHGLDLLLRKGTAIHWMPKEQMAVAERAKRGIRTSQDEAGRVHKWQDRPRGYGPWPNTARDCGLI